MTSSERAQPETDNKKQVFHVHLHHDDNDSFISRDPATVQPDLFTSELDRWRTFDWSRFGTIVLVIDIRHLWQTPGFHYWNLDCVVSYHWNCDQPDLPSISNGATFPRVWCQPWGDSRYGHRERVSAALPRDEFQAKGHFQSFL